MIYLIVGIIAVAWALAYACCVAAGRADEAASRERREAERTVEECDG